MNERIKELAGQALDQAVPQTWTTLTAYDLDKFTAKFAELIVKECCLQVADVRIEHDFDPTVDGVLVQALAGIRKYFGVEE